MPAQGPDRTSCHPLKPLQISHKDSMELYHKFAVRFQHKLCHLTTGSQRSHMSKLFSSAFTLAGHCLLLMCLAVSALFAFTAAEMNL